LIGGLGNQLFQYSAGRALSLRVGAAYRVDILDFKNYKLRNYDLRHFNVQAGIASKAERQIKSSSFLARLGLTGRQDLELYREKSFSYNKEFLILPDGTYLDGYWQSEKYFSDCSAQIRKDLVMTSAPSEANRRILDKIQTSHAVSIHVRRGDYVANRKTNAFHGTCSAEYYRKAVSHICEKVKSDVVCYVFSDDIPWVRENIDLGVEMVFVDGNDDENAFEDMRLMGACLHHVIANSTFSWWGAWLNPSPDKIVVAPLRWFNDESIDTSDLIPEQWVRM
jgi:hypothetical protein